MAQTLLTRRLEQTHTRLEDFAPAFDRNVVLYAKSLIVLMTIPFALILPLVFLRERRSFVAHVTFSLHLYTFLLILFCVALLAAKFSALLGFGGLEARWVDNVLSVANLDGVRALPLCGDRSGLRRDRRDACIASHPVWRLR